MSCAVSCAVSCVELTNAVVRGLPFQATSDPENGGCGGVVGLGTFALPAIKFDPFTVSVNAAPFGLALAGLRLEISGVLVCVGNTVNGAALMVIPPPGNGLETVTSAVPAVATSEARTVMAICPVFIFTAAERAEPFHNAVEVPVDPAMNIVKDWLPAVTLDGKSPVMIGVGFGWPGATVLPLLELQLDVRIVSTATLPNAVQRKRIKPVLLQFLPVVFPKTGAAVHERRWDSQTRETIETPASPLNNAQELIASRRTLVNSDSPGQCLVGPKFVGLVQICNAERAGLGATTLPNRVTRDDTSSAQRTRFDLGVQRRKFCEEFALLVVGDLGFEVDDKFVFGSVRLPAARLNFRRLDDAMRRHQEVGIGGGDQLESHEARLQSQAIFEITERDQGHQHHQRGKNCCGEHSGADGHADTGHHKDCGRACDAQHRAALANHHARADETDAGNNLRGDARVVAAY